MAPIKKARAAFLPRAPIFILLDQQQAPPAAQHAAPTAQQPSTAATTSPGTAAWALVAIAAIIATAALIIIFMSYSLIELSTEMLNQDRGGGDNGRTNRPRKGAITATGIATAFSAMPCDRRAISGTSVQQVTHIDAAMPSSGQQVCAESQRMVIALAGAGMVIVPPSKKAKTPKKTSSR